MNWSFDKPTKTGWYLINNGDVVTEDNMEPVRIYKNSDDTLMLEDFSGSVFLLEDILSCYKFLDIGYISKKNI